MDHKAEGERYLADNAKYPDISVTASGLQYMVRKQGSGPKPGPNATVEVNYHGTFINNKEFDSTYMGDPAVLSLNAVIAGWQEGIQLMPVGSIYKFYVPHELAYGADGFEDVIPPFAALIFEIELLDIVDPGSD
jgi:FKBP-type peptidyl-prolyl cis-trans isomerase